MRKSWHKGLQVSVDNCFWVSVRVDHTCRRPPPITPWSERYFPVGLRSGSNPGLHSMNSDGYRLLRPWGPSSSSSTGECARFSLASVGSDCSSHSEECREGGVEDGGREDDAVVDQADMCG
jgi:hypothetical protein